MQLLHERQLQQQLEKCYKHVIRYRLSYITLLKVDQHNVLELEEVDIARS